MYAVWKATDKVIRSLVGLCAVIACTALTLLAVIGALDIAGSNILGMGVPAATELSGAIMALMAFNALPFTQHRGEQIIVDIFVSRLQGPFARYLKATVLVFTTLFFVLLFLATLRYALSSLQQKEFASAAYTFAVYPFKLGAAFGAAVLALVGFRQCVQAWIDAANGTDSNDAATALTQVE